MDILVAIDNKEIKKKIDERYSRRVYYHDITFKEDVIEYIKNTCNNYTIITKMSLPGNMNDKEYIENLKKINSKNKIIVLVDKLNEEYKKFLFANEVFNIIEGNEVDIDLIYRQIENNEEKIIYKTILKDNRLSLKNNKIAVFGTNGSGKSFISSFVATCIAKYTSSDVLLDCLDISNPCIDIINNVVCNNCNISNYLSEITQNKNNVYKYITKDDSHKNLSYVNKNIEIESNNVKGFEINKFIKNLEGEFDYVILDLPNFTLSNSLRELLYIVDYIIFVVNPNYISLLQAKRYLEYICTNMGIKKEKIKLVINKENIYSLDIRQIKSILKDFNNIVNIKFFKEMDAYINGIIYGLPSNFKYEKKILEFLNINNKEKNKITNNIRKVE